MGHNTGEFLSGGDYNTGYGMSSLNKLTNGNNNIGLGYYSGYNITTGNYNICIGNGAGPTTSNSTETHRLYIDVGELVQRVVMKIHLFMVIKAVVIKTLL